VLQGQADLAEAVRQHMEALPKVCTEREFISELMFQATRLCDRAELALSSETPSRSREFTVSRRARAPLKVSGCAAARQSRCVNCLGYQLRCIEPATAPMGTHAIAAL